MFSGPLLKAFSTDAFGKRCQLQSGCQKAVRINKNSPAFGWAILLKDS